MPTSAPLPHAGLKATLHNRVPDHAMLAMISSSEDFASPTSRDEVSEEVSEEVFEEPGALSHPSCSCP